MSKNQKRYFSNQKYNVFIGTGRNFNLGSLYDLRASSRSLRRHGFFNDDCYVNFLVISFDNAALFYSVTGNYIGIVLKGGEESTMVFNTRLKPSISSFCFVTNFRKGPNVAGQLESNKATETFTIVEQNYEVAQDLPSFGGALQQQFSQFSMALGWNMETEVWFIYCSIHVFPSDILTSLLR